MNELETVWLAGYLEGEGCFKMGGITANYAGSPYISLESTDRDVIEKAAGLMGRAPIITCDPKPRCKPCFRVCIGGLAAVTVMQVILPYMGERRSSKIEEVLRLASQRPRGLSGYAARRRDTTVRNSLVPV